MWVNLSAPLVSLIQLAVAWKQQYREPGRVKTCPRTGKGSTYTIRLLTHGLKPFQLSRTPHLLGESIFSFLYATVSKACRSWSCCEVDLAFSEILTYFVSTTAWPQELGCCPWRAISFCPLPTCIHFRITKLSTYTLGKWLAKGRREALVACWYLLFQFVGLYLWIPSPNERMNNTMKKTKSITELKNSETTTCWFHK